MKWFVSRAMLCWLAAGMLLAACGEKDEEVEDGEQNQRPLAVVDGPIQVSIGGAVTLDGSGSSDPDGDEIAYLWQQVFGPAVDGSSPLEETLSFNAPLEEATLGFQLVVNDGLEESLPAYIELDVVDDNAAPVADAGEDQATPGGETVTLSGSGSDSDGDALSYEWAQVSGDYVELDGSDSAECSFVAPESNTVLAFELSVSDGLHTSEPDLVLVTVLWSGAPYADAGSDQVVEPGQNVVLDGSGVDPDGAPLAYSWSQLSGETVSLSADDIPDPTFTAPQTGGELVFELIVFNEGHSSDPDQVTIAVDRRPIADAGELQIVASGEVVQLDGSGSLDPDGDSLSYEWSQIAGSPVALDDPFAAQPSFTAPDEDVSLVFQLVVADSYSESYADAVAVQVQHNRPPEADAGSNVGTLNGQTAILEGSASDPDGDSIIGYQWEVIGTPPGGDDYQLTGQSSPTAHFTPFAKGEYTLSLAAADAEGFGAPDLVTVDSENNPPTAEAGEDVTLVNTQTAVLAGSGGDYDGDDLAYQWSVAGAPQDATWDLLDGDTDHPRLTPHTKGSYTVQLIVDDGEDASAPDTLTLTATNNPPEVDAGDDFSVAELAPAQLAPTVTDPDGETLDYSWEIVSTDPEGSSGSFSDASAEAPELSADSLGRYTLRLTVTDGDLASDWDEVSVDFYTLPGEEEHVFVAVEGDDAGGSCGSKAAPCATLGTAVQLADAEGKDVIVSAGEYQLVDRSLELPPGLRLLGGYDPDSWERDVDQFETVVRPGGRVEESGALIGDGLDNDCDALVDEPECIVEEEVCNNRDDDCNGVVDDVLVGECGDELEPNDASGDAAAIDFGVAYEGLEIVDSDTADWFSFDLAELPSSGEGWELEIQLACTEDCPTDAAEQIGLEVYLDGSDPADLLYSDETVYSGGTHYPIEIDVPAAEAQTGTYYLAVSAPAYGGYYGSPARYDLVAALREAGHDPEAGGLYDRGRPEGRDSYVFGIEGAVQMFQPGDENVIGGLTIHGQTETVQFALPAPYQDFGSVIYCDGCAVAIEDCEIRESQVARREIAGDGSDRSAAILVRDSLSYPVRVERNRIHLGYTKRARGVSLRNLGDMIVRENDFFADDASDDPYLERYAFVHLDFEDYGDERMIVDGNIFALSGKAGQNCRAIHSEKASDYHLFGEMFVTNNLFVAEGSCETHAPVYLATKELNDSQLHPHTLLLGNTFVGQGHSTAIRLSESHHGSADIAVVGNYIEGFEHGMYADYYRPYLGNNAFFDVDHCVYTYTGINCEPPDCDGCIAAEFADVDDGLWASQDNWYASCEFVDPSVYDYTPAAGSFCADSGDMLEIPIEFPQTPSWMEHDLLGADRPVDIDGADCPDGGTCDGSDIGAFERQGD